jgi:hypothetical protein
MIRSIRSEDGEEVVELTVSDVIDIDWIICLQSSHDYMKSRCTSLRLVDVDDMRVAVSK